MKFEEVGDPVGQLLAIQLRNAFGFWRLRSTQISHPWVLPKQLKNAWHCLQRVANDKDEDNEKADPEQEK